MLQLIALSWMAPALALDGPPTEGVPSSEVPCATLTGDAKVACGEVASRLAELGECELKNAKKRDACKTEKGELELRLAELRPPPPPSAAPPRKRAVPRRASQPSEPVDSLELDVEDE